MKILKFHRYQMEPVRGARALLTVKFLDDVGEVYSWAPRWNDTEQLFLKAINIESFNKPESEWLPRFSRAVKETAESVSQPIQSAYKVTGLFSRVHDGKLCLEENDGWNSTEVHTLIPLFPTTFEFLDSWLNRYNLEVLVINAVAVQLRDLNSGEIYPKPDSGPDDVDDSPF